jgi:glycosyltransferase involved in cell wall biosynthesis
VSQEAKEILLSRYPGLKVVVNENGVNPRRFSPEVSGKKPIERFALKGKFIIGYSGSLMWWHGIPVLLKAMEMVRRKARISGCMRRVGCALSTSFGTGAVPRITY